MNLVSQQTTTSKVDVYDHQGYGVTFRYEIADGQTAPTNVNATATEKAPTPAVPNFMPKIASVSVSPSGTNINKPNGANLLQTFYNDIEDKCLEIINGGTE